MKQRFLKAVAVSAIVLAIPLLRPSSAIGQTNTIPATDKSASSSQETKSGHTNSTVKTRAGKHLSAKPSSTGAAPSIPGVNAFEQKTIIRNGGARDLRLQLTPTLTPDQAVKQRRQTRDLLAISNENLKRIAQVQLDDNQQDMLQEVHNYMEQARLADKAGELQRAQTLASKARQLSDDLAGVRTLLKLWPW